MNYSYSSTLNIYSINQIFKLKDNLYFNVLGNFVVKNLEKIYLSLTEARLLLFFCTHPNKRLFASDIINHLEGYSSIQSEQNIYVYINRLRRKIEEHPDAPQLILNIRPGYIFNIEGL